MRDHRIQAQKSNYPKSLLRYICCRNRNRNYVFRAKGPALGPASKVIQLRRRKTRRKTEQEKKHLTKLVEAATCCLLSPLTTTTGWILRGYICCTTRPGNHCSYGTYDVQPITEGLKEREKKNQFLTKICFTCLMRYYFLWVINKLKKIPVNNCTLPQHLEENATLWRGFATPIKWQWNQEQ